MTSHRGKWYWKIFYIILYLLFHHLIISFDVDFDDYKPFPLWNICVCKLTSVYTSQYHEWNPLQPCPTLMITWQNWVRDLIRVQLVNAIPIPTVYHQRQTLCHYMVHIVSFRPADYVFTCRNLCDFVPQSVSFHTTLCVISYRRLCHFVPLTVISCGSLCDFVPQSVSIHTTLSVISYRSRCHFIPHSVSFLTAVGVISYHSLCHFLPQSV